MRAALRGTSSPDRRTAGRRRHQYFSSSYSRRYFLDPVLLDDELDARFILLPLAVPVEDAQRRLDHSRTPPSGTNSSSTSAIIGAAPRPPPTVTRKPFLPSLISAFRPRSWIGIRPWSCGAGRERDLELARQLLANGLSQEEASVASACGVTSKTRVFADARHMVAGHVAHRVAAGLTRRQPGVLEQPHDRRRVFELHEVVLDVLARRNVAELARRVVVGDVAKQRPSGPAFNVPCGTFTRTI